MDPKNSKLTQSIKGAKKASASGAAKSGKKGAKKGSTQTASAKTGNAKKIKAGKGDKVELKGTHRVKVAGSKPVGKVNPDEQVAITLRLKRKASGNFDSMLKELTTQPIAERRYLTREQLAAAHGAAEESVDKVEAFAHAHNLTILETNLATRSIKLQGSAADMEVAFGVKLMMFKAKHVEYRGRVGSIFIPKELAGIVEGVFGLDNRPAARSHVHFGAVAEALPAKSAKKKKKKPKPTPNPSPTPGTARAFSAPEVAALYNFPKQLTGKGQTIGLVELNTPNDPNQPTQNVGAGYVLSDIKSYFSALGITPPKITSISVDGGSNLPNLNTNADGEVELDIEVAGAIAPGANIAVYFAPNTDQGFIDCITAAVHDTVRKPSIISVSWGGPEDFSTQQFLDGINAALQDAAMLGVTVCVASGDSGSSDIDATSAANPKYKGPHADFPASSPYALGCGGTKLIANQGQIANETVWNEGRRGGAGGGGVSTKYPQPAWQPKGSVPKNPSGTAGRGTPDVCGNADPATGYNVVLQGATIPIGGTSAVAPLWAGLLALINEQLATAGKPALGFVNSVLYGLPASANAFHDITSGNNDIDGNLGVYSAGIGWDACTGLGSPDGTALMAALS